MKILLLGPSGQLGTEVTKLVGQRSGDMLESLDEADLDLVETASISPRIEQHQFDVLINCAADNQVDAAETHADRAFRINAFAVREMAACCRACGAILVHVSTDYIFSGTTERPYVEADAPNPLSVYGSSKLMGESLARSNHDRSIVLRTASLFGLSATGGNFVETMIHIGREKGRLQVVRDQIMSPTSAPSLARAIFGLLDAGVQQGTYHAVNSGQASWYEFAREILDLAGLHTHVDPIPAVEFPRPAQRPAFSVLDNRRLAEVIGPMPHWKEALEEYLRDAGHRE
jgi:dTDP-4-dehydrorhamnose reductase